MTTTAAAEITIRHTRADGTLIEGSRKGDGVYEAIRPHGFRYFPSLGQLGLPRSRDRRADTARIDNAAAVLRTAGHAVTIVIDEGVRRSFAEAEAERVERSQDRAERLAERAGRAAHVSATLRERAHRHADYPMGQPILVGHHSEGRHRRDLARADRLTRRSIEESDRASELGRRAASAEVYERGRNHIPTTLRRIEKPAAELRRIERDQATAADGWAEELRRRHEEVSEELAHWRAVVAQAEARGHKMWGRSDFQRGDFVQARGGQWYEVLRVNAKSLTVPGGPDVQPVISRQTRAYTWDDRFPYDKVTGRRTAEEMAARTGGPNAADG